jgi:hypothetical protein
MESHNRGRCEPEAPKLSYPVIGPWEVSTVRHFSSSDSVRLVKDLPELELRPGQVGTVKNKLNGVMPAYEVEFRYGDRPIRLLLLETHLMAA